MTRSSEDTYTSPSCTLTLAEAITQLRAIEGADNDAAENLAPELLKDIDIHDAIHAVFGCSTDLRGEIIAHVWTVFGTTTSARDMVRVNMHRDHREVLSAIGHGKLVGTWLRSLPRIVITVIRAARMKQRWPSNEFRSFLQVSLRDLRGRYGIKLGGKHPSEPRPGGASLRRVTLSQ